MKPLELTHFGKVCYLPERRRGQPVGARKEVNTTQAIISRLHLGKP
jgi:hypothetical protein